MDTQTEQLVRDTVAQFVKDGFMFTAFDVTRTLRKGGANLHHKECNGIVQGMFRDGDMGTYVRDAVDVNAPVMPFVYYHPYGDVSKYDQDWCNSNPTQTGMKVDTATAPATGGGSTNSGAYTPPSLDGDGTGTGTATATATAVAATAPAQMGAQSASPFAQTSMTPIKLAKGERLTTKNGRLQIPINMARQAGYTANQTVHIGLVGSTLEIGAVAVSGVTGWPVLVEHDSRIRICRTILNRISKGNKFRVDRNTNTIVVSVA